MLETLIDERFVPNYDVNTKVTEDCRQLSVTPEFSDAVFQITCPVLVVHGSGEPRPVSAVQRLAEGLPDSEVAVIEGAGHFPWLEAPERFASVVRPLFL